MKIRLGLIIKIVVAVLIIGLLIWRFWPQSSANLITVDKNAIISFAGIASVSRNENGQPRIDSYQIDNEQQGVEPGAILEIIASTKYQQDFRNLLPWRAESIDADKNYDGRNVSLVFTVGNQQDEWGHIQYMSSSMIIVYTGGEEGYYIYHPIDHEVLDELIEYFQAHGIKK